MALSEGEVIDATKKLLELRDGEQRRLKKIAAYMKGDASSVYVPKGARQEYKWLIKRAKVNVLPLVVTVVAQALYVDGYRPAGSDSNAKAWEIWQANRMDARQHGLHRAALKYGTAYAVVMPGRPVPVISPKSPRRMTAFYRDPVEDEWPEFAVEETVQYTLKGKVRAVRLYDAQHRYSLEARDSDGGKLRLVRAEEHGLGVCPVIRYLNGDDLDGDDCVRGEVEPLIEMQDQLNSTTFNLLMAQQYAAFRQRYVAGMVPTDEDGVPKAPFQAAVDRLWVAEDPDVKFGEFSQPLALDTPVPTPSGWTTIGEIQAGDMVLGRDGRPARVLGMSPVFTDRTCYRITFADGTSVVSDGGHRWVVIDRQRPSWGEMVCTTEEMAQQVRLEGARPGWRWAVPQAEPLDLKPADLPLHPYILGYWLGDGNASCARITVGDRDRAALVEQIERLGYRVVSQTRDRRTGAWDVGFSTESSGPERVCLMEGCGKPHKGYGLCNTHYTYAKRHGQLPDVHGRESAKKRLRDLGVLGNKHIPAIYLRGSFEQRIDLLKGLLDSDGSVNRTKTAAWCTFSNTNKVLVDGVLELARSLGLRPTCKMTRSGGDGVSPLWVVGFQAPGDFVPFALPRKAEKCPVGGKSARQRYRSIVAIEKVPSVPVRCLGVDTEDHLFLVGEGFVPTHNTDLSGYLQSAEATIRHIATVSQTPPHHLLGQMANLSAEALAAAESGLQRKIAERKSSFGESHEQTLRLAALAAGDRKGWDDVSAQVVWRDTEARALASTVDALGKLTQMLQIPPQELWERIPGVTATDVARWKRAAERAAKDADAMEKLNQMIDRQMGGSARPQRQEQPAQAASNGAAGGGQQREPATAGAAGANAERAR
uniref:DOD-type homing endonuclease domain-containing protein n=1 Tax=Thermocrispum agreste TaxID=37925 RepID=A0A2W4JKM7_9PSEU|nr:MAG: hypothetical protein DIU77_07270 [Thermocrispum agreste]